MIFFLRKLAEAAMLPVGLSIFLGLAGIILRRRRIALAGVAVLLLFSPEVVGVSLVGVLEREYPPIAVADAPTADAIVVLSGAVVRGVNKAGVQWGEASNRYFSGLDLALAGKARWLVFTAADGAEPNGPTQGDIMKQAAIRAGVPADRVLVTPHRVLTTDDEAREVSQMPDIHSVLLVTSGVHMPRAALLFRAHGLNVVPFSTDQRVIASGHTSSLGFIPDARGLQESDQALREYYGLAVYHLILMFR